MMTITALDVALCAGALFILLLTPGPVWLAMAARTLAHGLTAILASPKAVLFYMGMLPGFFDLAAPT